MGGICIHMATIPLRFLIIKIAKIFKIKFEEKDFSTFLAAMISKAHIYNTFFALSYADIS
jgi:hypothetical protein